MGVINPWDFLPPGKSAKLAKECQELHCARQNADAFASVEEWSKFPNLAVLWVNDNRLTRIENLEANFRLRELYMQDNRFVSLQGLYTFKFLRVLRVGNNQIRNLDKQIGVLKRFAFLEELDLYENPVAEEPDYRLRVIYHLPQVQLLDLKAVKDHERETAGKVVPNMNTVMVSAPGDVLHRPKQKWVNTKNEDWVFSCAEKIRIKWKLAEEEAVRKMYEGLGGLKHENFSETYVPPSNQHLKDYDYRVNRSYYELKELNGEERSWIHSFFKSDILGKGDGPMNPKAWSEYIAASKSQKYTREKFAEIFFQESEEHNESGTNAISRFQQLWDRLGKIPNPAAFVDTKVEEPEDDEDGGAPAKVPDAASPSSPSKGATSPEDIPAASIWDQFDADGNIDLYTIASFVTSEHLVWRYEDDESIADRVSYLYQEAKKKGPPLGSDLPTAQKCSMMALRLEGVRTRKDATFARIHEDNGNVIPRHITLEASVLDSLEREDRGPNPSILDRKQNYGRNIGPKNYNHVYPKMSMMTPHLTEPGEHKRSDVFPQQGLTEFKVTDKKGRIKPKCKLEKSGYRFDC